MGNWFPGSAGSAWEPPALQAPPDGNVEAEPTALNIFTLKLIYENAGREGEATALKIFDLILTNQNVDRECEAPAELSPRLPIYNPCL